ncbi:MAG: WG repeat-containing protein, partial [Bacteroidota bacterium]|nr:WG repeat-containing protein [Bacteroidota bacterium]
KNGKPYFKVYQGEQYGLFDGKGRQLLPFEYTEYTELNIDYYPQASGYAENFIIALTKDDRIGLYHVGLDKVILPVAHEFIVWNRFDQINAHKGAEDQGYDIEHVLLNGEGDVIRPYSKEVSYTAVAADRFVETRMVDGKWRNSLVDAGGKILYENSGWDRFESNSVTQLLLPKDTTLDAGYRDGLLKIRSEEQNLFIDRDGNETHFKDYGFVGDFFNNRALAMAYASPLDPEETIRSARDKERFGIIDSQGNELLPAVYERMEKIYDAPELLKVKKGDRWGVTTKRGAVVVKTEYDDIRFSSSRKAHVDITKNGKMGLLKWDGTVLVPPIYDRIYKNYSSFAEEAQLYMVFDGEWYRFIDEEGSLLSIRAKSRLE